MLETDVKRSLDSSYIPFTHTQIKPRVHTSTSRTQRLHAFVRRRSCPAASPPASTPDPIHHSFLSHRASDLSSIAEASCMEQRRWRGAGAGLPCGQCVSSMAGRKGGRDSLPPQCSVLLLLPRHNNVVARHLLVFVVVTACVV